MAVIQEPRTVSFSEKREKLKDFSSRAKAIREELFKKAKTPQAIQAIEDMNINDLIVNYIYKDGTHQQFNTFKGWIKNGFCVKKGEKAFLLWGRKKQKTTKPNGKEKTEELDFFPVSYVFSNNQVKPLENDKK